jgi:hypothetical protein
MMPTWVWVFFWAIWCVCVGVVLQTVDFLAAFSL